MDQLTEGGLLVVPLRLRGTTRSIAFQRRGQRLASCSVKLCGFIPMRNDHGEREIDLGGGVTLLCDADQDIHRTDLGTVLDEPKHTVWSGTEVGTEPVHGIWGRLAVEEAGTCRIAAQPSAVKSGRATPVIPMLSPALVQGRTDTSRCAGRSKTHSGTLSTVGAPPAELQPLRSRDEGTLPPSLTVDTSYPVAR